MYRSADPDRIKECFFAANLAPFSRAGRNGPLNVLNALEQVQNVRGDQVGYDQKTFGRLSGKDVVFVCAAKQN